MNADPATVTDVEQRWEVMKTWGSYQRTYLTQTNERTNEEINNIKVINYGINYANIRYFVRPSVCRYNQAFHVENILPWAQNRTGQ